MELARTMVTKTVSRWATTTIVSRIAVQKEIYQSYVG
jgi:hypothetical protein